VPVLNAFLGLAGLGGYEGAVHSGEGAARDDLFFLLKQFLLLVEEGDVVQIF
jgi:hypothetical protein